MFPGLDASERGSDFGASAASGGDKGVDVRGRRGKGDLLDGAVNAPDRTREQSVQRRFGVDPLPLQVLPLAQGARVLGLHAHDIGLQPEPLRVPGPRHGLVALQQLLALPVDRQRPVDERQVVPGALDRANQVGALGPMQFALFDRRGSRHPAPQIKLPEAREPLADRKHRNLGTHPRLRRLDMLGQREHRVGPGRRLDHAMARRLPCRPSRPNLRVVRQPFFDQGGQPLVAVGGVRQ